MLYKLSKFMYVVFLFYLGIFQYVFFQIPNALFFLGMSMIILLLLNKVMTSTKVTLVVSLPVEVWIAFAFYSLLTGFFVAENKALLVTSLLTYSQTLILMIYVIDVSVYEKTNKFFIKVYAVFSTVYMILMLNIGTYAFASNRLSLSAGSNPNSDGMILLLGVFCILLLINQKKLMTFYFSLIIVGFKIYTIILTGSRKAFILVSLMVALWLVTVFRKQWKLLTNTKKILSVLTVGMALVVGMIYLQSFLYDSFLYERLTRDGGTSILLARSGWADEAIRLFKSSPLVGVGFNHYRVLSVYKTYSHSTFLELIANSGLIGTIMYFIPFFMIGHSLIKLYLRNRMSRTEYVTLQYIILLITWLLLAMGVIIFYGIIDSLALGLIISYYTVEKRKQINIKNPKEANGRGANYV